MRYILFILLVLVIGCASQKRCLIKFPPDTITRIEAVYDVFFKDTLIEVLVPGDTVYIESPWTDNIVWTNVPDGYISPGLIVEHHIAAIRADVPLAYSKAWVDNNMLKMLLIQKDSVFQFKLDSAIRVNTDSIFIYKPMIVEKEVEPKWSQFYKNSFWFATALLIIFGALAFLFIKMK